LAAKRVAQSYRDLLALRPGFLAVPRDCEASTNCSAAVFFRRGGLCAPFDKNFQPARLGSEKAGLDAFLDLLRAFHIACNTAIKQ